MPSHSTAGTWSPPRRGGRGRQFIFEGIEPAVVRGAESYGQILTGVEQARVQRAQQLADEEARRRWEAAGEGIEPQPGESFEILGRRRGAEMGRRQALGEKVGIAGAVRGMAPVERVPGAQQEAAETFMPGGGPTFGGFVPREAAPKPVAVDPLLEDKRRLLEARAAAARRGPRAAAPPNWESAYQQGLDRVQRAALSQHARATAGPQARILALGRGLSPEMQNEFLQWAASGGMNRGEPPPVTADTAAGAAILAAFGDLPPPPDLGAIEAAFQADWNRRSAAFGHPQVPAAPRRPREDDFGSKGEFLSAVEMWERATGQRWAPGP